MLGQSILDQWVVNAAVLVLAAVLFGSSQLSAASGLVHLVCHFYTVGQKVPVAFQFQSLCVTHVPECHDDAHAVILQNKCLSVLV